MTDLNFPSFESLCAWAGTDNYRHFIDFKKGRKVIATILEVHKDKMIYYFSQKKKEFSLLATSYRDIFAEEKEEE